jgi:hypothetical protein
MSNRIDQLFKTKLAHHRVPPSPEAWSKIEAGLTKKNNSPLIWWAAAVFLLFVLGGGVWIGFPSSDQVSSAVSQGTPRNGQPVAVDTAKQVASAVHPKQATKQVTPVFEKTSPPVQKRENLTTLAEEKVRLSTEQTETLTETTESVKTETMHTITVASAEKPIVIEFVLEPVPNTSIAQNQESEKSGFQKILKKARDVKNGESDLGFREAKNDLFAFGRKDKTKRNY